MTETKTSWNFVEESVIYKLVIKALVWHMNKIYWDQKALETLLRGFLFCFVLGFSWSVHTISYPSL